MSFFKNLFKKPPIVQEQLNVGKIIATIELTNGEKIKYIFEGWYSSSHDMSCFGRTSWFDHFTTATEIFDEWMNVTSKRKFLRISGEEFLPLASIAKITTTKEDLFVETQRK